MTHELNALMKFCKLTLWRLYQTTKARNRSLDCRKELIDDLVDATNRNQTLLDEITSTNRNRPKGSTS